MLIYAHDRCERLGDMTACYSAYYVARITMSHDENIAVAPETVMAANASHTM